MKHTKVILDPMYGGCGGVILAKCENCTNKPPSCYEEDCGVQNDANAALAQYEAITHDKDGNEVITLDHLRELAEADKKGRVVVLPCKVGDVVAWDNGSGSVLKLFVKAVYHDGIEARLLLKNAAGKFFDAEPLANHPALRYGAEAARALSSAGEGAE